jgi:hypothetical protein
VRVKIPKQVNPLTLVSPAVGREEKTDCFVVLRVWENGLLATTVKLPIKEIIILKKINIKDLNAEETN